MDWTNIIIALVGAVFGAGFWQVIKSMVDKKKTPYDMFMELMQKQTEFYDALNASYEQEKMDSAEKSAVIAKTHKCKHRFKDPDIICPVETANEERLNNRCIRCEYNPEKDDAK